MQYSYIYKYEFLLKFSFHARISFCATFCYWRSLVLGAKNFAFCSTNFSRKIICTQRKIEEYCGILRKSGSTSCANNVQKFATKIVRNMCKKSCHSAKTPIEADRKPYPLIFHNFYKISIKFKLVVLTWTAPSFLINYAL